VFPKLAVSPMRDFIGVSMLSDVTLGVVVHPSVPVATLKEFINLAKARQGQLNYSSTGPSSAARLSFAFMAQKAGLKIGHIPYKDGGGAATLAVITGEVEVTMQAVSSFLPHVKTGRLRALAVVAPERIPQLPAIPTLAESGFPELTLGSWHAVYVPAGTPRPIVDKLHAAVLKVMKDPDIHARYRAGAAAIVTSKSPEEFAVFMKAQTDFWAKLVKGLGAVEG
jgi:tripartite-type tricarboxylate transporter receptor subunit TctC